MLMMPIAQVTVTNGNDQDCLTMPFMATRMPCELKVSIVPVIASSQVLRGDNG